MTTNQPKRIGRPPKAPTEVRAKTLAVRVTDDQHDKVTALGGPDWVRGTIDAAPDPRKKATRRKGTT